MVLEGVNLLPDYVATLLNKYGPETIHAVFIGSTDAAQVLDGMAKNDNPNDWLKGADEPVLRQVADFTVAFSRYLEREAQRHGLPFVARTEDFHGDLRTIQDLLRDH